MNVVLKTLLQYLLNCSNTFSQPDTSLPKNIAVIIYRASLLFSYPFFQLQNIGSMVWFHK